MINLVFMQVITISDKFPSNAIKFDKILSLKLLKIYLYIFQKIIVFDIYSFIFI